MAKALVSGGSGFLGSHLCDRLLEEGIEVVVLDNFITGRRENLGHLSNEPHLELIEQDVSEAFEYEGAVDYVFHLASPASPPDFSRIPFETMRAGSYATHNLIELASEKGARFLFASTSEIYGDPPPEHHPQQEEYFGNVNPNGVRSVYDEAKRYGEAVTMAYHREYGLATRIVRIFNTYGPRMRPDDGRVVTNLACQALRGEPLTLYGDGSQTRSFGFVTDTADGIYRLMMSDEVTPVNIGNPREFTVRQLAGMILDMTGSRSEIITVPLPTADDPKQRCPDISKAKRVLGWEPTVEIEAGLKETIAYLRGSIDL